MIDGVVAFLLRWWWVVLCVAAASALTFGKMIDREILGESVRDFRAQLTGADEWHLTLPLSRSLDYRWVELAGSGELRVAHALGAAGTAAANTLPAAVAALTAGFSLLEVDVWLDSEDALRCHHGPEAPVPDPGDACTLARLLALLQSHPRIKLILDIKTDFDRTGAAVLRLLDRLGPLATQQTIFQLYHPRHLNAFSHWAEGRALPGPIVTTYLSPWSLGHVELELPRLNVQAFTFPFYRRAALAKRPLVGPSRLVHPIHDCSSLAAARHLGVKGIYTVTALRCDSDGVPSSER